MDSPWQLSLNGVGNLGLTGLVDQAISRAAGIVQTVPSLASAIFRIRRSSQAGSTPDTPFV